MPGPGAILYAALVAVDLSAGNAIDRPYPTMGECDDALEQIEADLPPPPPGYFHVLDCVPPKRR